MTSGAEFYFKGTRIRITFGFFAVWSVLIMQSPVSKAGELALLSCLLHEGGHITAMAPYILQRRHRHEKRSNIVPCP